MWDLDGWGLRLQGSLPVPWPVLEERDMDRKEVADRRAHWWKAELVGRHNWWKAELVGKQN